VAVHGKNTEVLLGAINLSPYMNSADFSIDVDTADTTTFGSAWKTAIAGQAGSKADFAGLYDPAVTAMTDLLGTDFGTILSYAPGGATAIGDRMRLMSVAETAYSESSPVGDVVAFKVSFMGSGVAGDAALLHPLSEDTNTTTGAEKDDTAATNTGWTAHLHVTAVDGGSWVIQLQDAAVTDTHSNLTGGAFTAATGPTSQRLVSASATTTLRRYIRYVATRTGGSAGDGITFSLSYARNA